MNPVFSRLLDEARQLARNGSLAGARAALQRAWSDAAARTRLPGRRALRPASFESGLFAAPSGGMREYKLFVPAGVERVARPLVVMLHGCGQDPDDFAAGTRMNEHAQERGWFVLYPAQAPRSNHHRCWNWFKPGDQRRGAGEPELLAGMTRHVMALHEVDGARVFVAGLSAGAGMADILAREYPDLFAAAGVHSGVPHGAAHDVASAYAAMSGGGGSLLHLAMRSIFVTPAAPDEADPATDATPTIVFHGDADDTVHPSNGERVIRALLDRAGTSSGRIEATVVRAALSGRAVTRTVHHRAGARRGGPSLAEHWLVHGGGHAWSGGSGDGSYADALGPDASREMLRFFAEHPRPRSAPGVFSFRHTVPRAAAKRLSTADCRR
jgi:poly(hydroxyalkanoate) depolymerase family esterase